MARAQPDRQAALAFNAANAAYAEGRFADAIADAERAIRAMPGLANAHVLRARALRALGRDDAARHAYEAALAIAPEHFDALLEQGNTLRALGDPAAARQFYRRAMAARPEDPRPALAWARLEEEAPGQPARDRAAVLLQKALDRAAQGPEPGQAMARLFRDMAGFRLARSDLAGALEALRQARLAAQPSAPPELAWSIDHALADVFFRLDMTDKALALVQRLARTEDRDKLLALAYLAYRNNCWSEAIQILRRNAGLRPEDPAAHLELAEVQAASWLIGDATASLERAIAAAGEPTLPMTALRARIANRMGDSAAALKIYRQLLDEGHAQFGSSYAMSLLYADDLTPEEVAARHRAICGDWGRPGARLPIADPDPDRPLRIGMVSPDLHHQHPVNIFIQPLLARWPHERMPLTVYFTGQTFDAQTRLARSRATRWRHVGQDDLARQVAADGIDILIDLAGHTSGKGMKAFATRLAPVQVSFLGYPGSTGVPNMDWMLGDPVVTPPEADHLCTERVMRLPDTVFCFAPEEDYPLPQFDALKARPLTFGSFNNIAKLGPHTIRLWAGVLAALPNSRLVLRAPSFRDAAAVARFRDLFAAQGVDPSRLRFEGPVGLDEMMAAYAEIDVGLDTFPYGGGTTTLQALWMGVPVLSLRGGHFVSRMGASFLTAAGLPDWVAESEADYVRKARQLTRDRAKLFDLKRGLRARLAACPAWDADRYAESFENALREIWRKTLDDRQDIRPPATADRIET